MLSLAFNAMGLLATLLGKILGKGTPSTQLTAATGTQPPPPGGTPPTVAAGNPPAGVSAPASGTAPAPVVDVTAILDCDQEDRGERRKTSPRFVEVISSTEFGS
jgi:hypothetical protein